MDSIKWYIKLTVKHIIQTGAHQRLTTDTYSSKSVTLDLFHQDVKCT